MTFRCHLLGEIVASTKITGVIGVLTDAIFFGGCRDAGRQCSGMAGRCSVMNCALQRC